MQLTKTILNVYTLELTRRKYMDGWMDGWWLRSETSQARVNEVNISNTLPLERDK